MDDFVTTYNKDFCWPWELPVKTDTVWPPHERPIVRPKLCPALPCPECPCPNHTWASRAAHYACLAEKEAGLHRKLQQTRFEIERCEKKNTNDGDDKLNRPIGPPDPEPRLTSYMIDYARKDTTPLSFVELLAEIRSAGIPAGPLGRRNFGMYTDPNKFRKSFYTTPIYDPTRPVHRLPYEDITLKYFREYPGISEYSGSIGKTAEVNWKKSQQEKYPAPLLPARPVSSEVVPATSAAC